MENEEVPEQAVAPGEEEAPVAVAAVPQPPHEAHPWPEWEVELDQRQLLRQLTFLFFFWSTVILSLVLVSNTCPTAPSYLEEQIPESRSSWLSW